jgi:hypothetical protein
VTIKITKSCSVRLNGEVKALKAGETITLPREKAQKIISAGYAEVIKPDLEELRRLCGEITERDPKGGCWDWILTHRPELWREHIAAFWNGDLAHARATFNQMIDAWNTDNEQ